MLHISGDVFYRLVRGANVSLWRRARFRIVQLLITGGQDVRSSVRKLHLNWGCASAAELKRILLGTEIAENTDPRVAGEAARQCEGFLAFK